LSTSAAFKITAFDSRAALECALLLDAALTSGDKRAQAKTWAKAKFDWQIVAIAKVANVRTIYPIFLCYPAGMRAGAGGASAVRG
jgi:hypothetical protein